MIHSTATIGLAICLACLAAVATWAYVRSRPHEALALAKADLVGHLIASGGLFTLLPEGVKIFAPELVGPAALTGIVWEHLDYGSFALISTAIGVNVMRRILQVRMLARPV